MLSIQKYKKYFPECYKHGTLDQIWSQKEYKWLCKHGSCKSESFGLTHEMFIKMMADSNTKPRKVYCFKCKRKVNVTKYEINQNSRGAYQVAGECGNHPDSDKPVKVFGFIKASDV